MENSAIVIAMLTEQSRKLDEIEIEIMKLKFRASAWGAITGALTALVMTVFGCGCGALPAQSYPEQRDLLGATVALVQEDDADTYCAGAHVGNGRIVTAAHCVVNESGLTELSVFVQGVDEQGTLASHQATVVRVDEVQDVATLQIQDGYTPRASFDMASDVPYIQESVWACGHPWGLTWSITRGEVVSQHRNDNGMDWIQVDIAVDPGNSGGPLVDSDGDLVGITSFKMGRQSGFAHLSSVITILE